MADLQQIATQAIDDLRQTAEEQYWRPKSKDVADAVLAAIRRDHAIVERVGADVVEAAVRKALCDMSGFVDGDLDCFSPGFLDEVRDHVHSAYPIIATHARDAALEEADAWLRAKAEAVAGDDPANITAKTMGRVIVWFADETRDALLPTPPQPDPVSAAREAVVQAAMARHVAVLMMDVPEGTWTAVNKAGNALDKACAALAALEKGEG